MTNQLIEQFTDAGVFLALLLGGLGLPLPEEVPIVASAALAHQGIIRGWLALPLCLVAVIAADALVYWVGCRWGAGIVRWRVTRLVLTPRRRDWLEQAYRRHGAKIVFAARHAMGLRPAASLTAGLHRIERWLLLVGLILAAAWLALGAHGRMRMR